jgi:hypothetical protein
MFNPQTEIVSKSLEFDIKTIKKTNHTTHNLFTVYKSINTLHIAI